MRYLPGVLLLAGVAGLAPAAPVPTAPPVEALVEKLGDPGYRERDAAARELLDRGAAALPALEAAAGGHADAEVRWRAGALAERLRRTADAARLIAPMRLRLDYDRRPLAAALADLRARTGIPLVLDDRAVADAARPVTVRTGDVTAWEALDAFCRAAGLTEAFRAELGGGPAEQEALRQRRVVYAIPSLPPPETAGQVPVVLVDGPARAIPGDRSTAVRILALPPSFPGHRIVRGAGEVVLNLDVTPLPGVRWDDVTAVRIHRAEDETGRPVTVSHRTEPPADPFQLHEGIFLGGPGQVVVWNGDMAFAQQSAGARPNPRVVPVALKTDDRAIRTLTVFEGVVVGSVTIPNQPLATIEGLAKAAGVTAHAPGDLRVAVLSHQPQAGGDLVIKVRYDNPNPWTAQRLARRPFAPPMAGMGWMESGPGRTGGPQAQFFDTAGQRVAPTQTRTVGAGDDGFRQTSEVEYTFSKAKPAPDRLIVIGDRPATVEIPFKLRNVPLP
jgi:hypothetical protein